MNNRDVLSIICSYLLEPDILSLVSCNRYLRSLYTRVELMRLVYISKIWRTDTNAKRLRWLLAAGVRPRPNLLWCNFCCVNFTDLGVRGDLSHYSKCSVYNAVKRRLKPDDHRFFVASLMCRICGTCEDSPMFFRYNAPLVHWTLPCRKCNTLTKVVKAGAGCLKCGICCKKCSKMRKYGCYYSNISMRQIIPPRIDI